VASKQLGPQPVVVLLPPGFQPGRSYPLLLAFSGRGEAVMAPERGAWGWARDYGLARQLEAVQRGRLTARDFGGLVSPSRLQRYNRSLAAAPFSGMVVACPHTFDLLGAGQLRRTDYEQFYIEELPRELRRRYDLRGGPEALGVDGVSLGGLWSLLLGFAHPDRVGQIGALQPAVTPYLEQLVALAADRLEALKRRPLSLVTSTGDGLRPVVTRLSEELRRLGLPHSFTLLDGPHDYEFNRGPGGLQMLLWHDRKFQGQPL